MESNNTILNNENFLNTFQHFPNNMALELNSISLSNTHTNNTDFNLINNNNYSSSNNLGTDREKYPNSNINTIQPNEQIIDLSMALSQNLNISSDNNKIKKRKKKKNAKKKKKMRKILIQQKKKIIIMKIILCLNSLMEIYFKI